jgi:hypothetical protein
MVSCAALAHTHLRFGILLSTELEQPSVSRLITKGLENHGQDWAQLWVWPASMEQIDIVASFAE